MSNEHETVADIVAEMREHGAAISGLLIPDDDGPTRAMTPDLADRLEAAAKRENVAGNAARLREALRLTMKNLCEECGCRLECENIKDWQCPVRDIVDAALAAPARNCDFYATAEEAKAAFEQAHKSRLGFVNLYSAVFKWLFAPAKEDNK